MLKEHIVKDKAEEIDFDQCGTFSLASDDTEFNELKQTAALMEEFKIPVEVVDSEGVRQRLGAKGFVGGIKYIDDACVNPIKLSQKILELSGADFFAGAEVSRVEQADGERIVRTSKGSFKAPMVIYATNGYMAQLNSFFSDKIYPTKGQIMVTEPVEKFMEAPCYAHFVLDYFRQLPSGELLIGGFRQIEKDTEVGYSDHISETVQGALLDFTKKHLPNFANCKVTHRWAGVMGFSVDGQQIIGALPEDPQILFIGGFTAHGLGLAFHTGKCLVDMIFAREVPEFISAKRFN